MSVDKYLSLADKFRKMGCRDNALVMYYVLNNAAKQNGDSELKDYTQKLINKYVYNIETFTYDMSLDAAAPVNREPVSPHSNNIPLPVSRPVGNKTFNFSIKKETKDMINNRLEQARLVLERGGYMKAEQIQWRNLFSGNTKYDKIKWTGEKGHIVYFIQAIQDYIQNNTGFGIWEIVAAHFKWYFTFKNGKIADEDFNHRRLSDGKAKQTKALDNAASWFKPQLNPNYENDDQEEENPYTYNKDLTSSELESDAWNNGLDVPHSGISYPDYDSDMNGSDFHLSDDF
ncbi:MAG: hypothetical protein J5671_09185 [Bacteroidaceae bacterium]|nr:hypothetical protein [Bacteroidaceae bacterium]